MVLAILFPSCFFKSVLNVIWVIGKHPRYIGFLQWVRWQGFSSQKLTKSQKKHISKLSFNTTAQNRSKAAGENGNQVSRVTNLPAAFWCRISLWQLCVPLATVTITKPSKNTVFLRGTEILEKKEI